MSPRHISGNSLIVISTKINQKFGVAYWCTRVLGSSRNASEPVSARFEQKKIGPLLDCDDTLIDGAVNEMFGRFVSCQPGFGRSD